VVGISRLSDVARHIIQPSGIAGTDWPRVRSTCERFGWVFDGWQDGAGRLILATRDDGLYASDTVAMSIPRQVGKTYLMAAIIFALCLINPKITAIWTAHRVKTSKETFASMTGLAQQAKVKAHVRQIVRGRGDEAVNFTNGSRVLFGAREQGFGRGFSKVDILVFDEAQILGESAMEDMLAAQNVAPNPLTIMAGTPPRPKDMGEVFTMIRQEALAGDSRETLYIELSADRAADIDDREQWRKANPSFPSRTPERAMLRLRKNLTAESFRREALGVWDEVKKHRAVISPYVWDTLADVGPADGVAPSALAVDMNHDRFVSIAAAWREGETTHLEEVWAGPDASAAMEWLILRATRRTPIVIDAMSPAAALVAPLKGRRLRVVTSTAPDMAKACGLLVDKANTGHVTHSGQESIKVALLGAIKRPIGAAGGWGFDRSDPDVDISPLVAGTLALFGAETVKRMQDAVFV